jgi:hypothetical protein
MNNSNVGFLPSGSEPDLLGYIYNIYLPSKDILNQLVFPDSCPYDSCQDNPTQKNKADLHVFGYNQNFILMRKIQYDDDWKKYIAVTDPPIPEGAKYVQNVRRYYYEKPW